MKGSKRCIRKNPGRSAYQSLSGAERKTLRRRISAKGGEDPFPGKKDLK
jgi:hypothetical protein